mgnify:CR=1 FL=1
MKDEDDCNCPLCQMMDATLAENQMAAEMLRKGKVKPGKCVELRISHNIQWVCDGVVKPKDLWNIDEVAKYYSFDEIYETYDPWAATVTYTILPLNNFPLTPC